MSRLIDPRVQHARRPTPTALSHQRQGMQDREDRLDSKAQTLAVMRSIGLAGCPLSDRDLDTLRLIAEGMTNGRIAALRGRSESTIKNQMTRILRKLGALTRTDAVRHMDDDWPNWRSGERERDPSLPVRVVVRQLRALADQLEWEAKRVGDVA